MRETMKSNRTVALCDLLHSLIKKDFGTIITKFELWIKTKFKQINLCFYGKNKNGFQLAENWEKIGES